MCIYIYIYICITHIYYVYIICRYISMHTDRCMCLQRNKSKLLTVQTHCLTKSLYIHIYIHIHIYIVYVWCISNVATFFKASVCVFYKSNKNRKLQYPRMKFSKLKISPTHDWLVKFLPSSPPWAFHTGPFATHPWISWCLGCMWALALTLGPLHFHRVMLAFEMGIHIYRIIWVYHLSWWCKWATVRSF